MTDMPLGEISQLESPLPPNAEGVQGGASESIDTEDSMVCYCYRYTTSMLRKAHKECGSLKALEEKTRVGTGCTGCKVILQSLFGETPSDHYKLDQSPAFGSSCRRPGSRVMHGFVISDGNLESKVYSSNGVAPQLGDCNADSEIAYALVDHRGVPILQRTQKLRTNETFIFATEKENIPRPFFGMFLLAFDRSNYGASRFNVYWGNKNSVSATHENTLTGRPQVFLPVIVDRQFLDGNNTIFAAIMNPHRRPIGFRIIARELDSQQEAYWDSELPPRCSMWINANEHFFAPTLEKFGEGKVLLQLKTKADMHSALAMYFFIHNKSTDLWSVNHL